LQICRRTLSRRVAASTKTIAMLAFATLLLTSCDDQRSLSSESRSAMAQTDTATGCFSLVDLQISEGAVSRSSTEMRVALADFDTPDHRVEAFFSLPSLKARLLVNEAISVNLGHAAVPLKSLSLSPTLLAVVLRDIPSNRLNVLLVDTEMRTNRLTPLDAQEQEPFDFRNAVVAGSDVCFALFDNVEKKNFVQWYGVNGETLSALSDRMVLPSVEYPAGANYEVTPDVIMVPVGTEVYILSQRAAVRVSRATMQQISPPSDCARFIEAAASSEGLIVLYETVAPTSCLYQLYNINAKRSLPYDCNLGIPYNLRVEDDQLCFSQLSSSSDLADLFRFDITRSKGAGALYFGTNNYEGSIPWSQVYYLNGLLDLLSLAAVDGAFRVALEPVLSEVRQRLELEILVLDSILQRDPGMACRTFTLDRVETLFAVQTSRVLLLLHRYLHQLPDVAALGSYQELKHAVWTLDGHIEVLATEGESNRWLSEGESYLRWPRGCAFPFDGVCVPYNHQNEWAGAILATSDDSDDAPIEAALGILRLFTGDVALLGEMPLSMDWPYWWGTAWDGWTSTSGVSKNMPAYSGDHGTAWISFKSIDVMSLLIALEYLPEPLRASLPAYAIRAINAGKLFPFVARYIPYSSVRASIDSDALLSYIRLNAPQQLANCVWAYGALLPSLAR